MLSRLEAHRSLPLSSLVRSTSTIIGHLQPLLPCRVFAMNYVDFMEYYPTAFSYQLLY